MTQEEKELLLKDLCARLPYEVNIQVYYEDMSVSGYFDETVWLVDNDEPFHVNDRWIEQVKPYLRPMSSMTEEEKKEFSAFGFEVIDHINANRDECPKYQVIEVSNFSVITKVTDWLNTHHFDYRGLIEKGLALEAPNNIYKI